MVDGVQKAGVIGWLRLPATHQSCCLQNGTATQQHRAKTPGKPIQITDLLDFPDHTLHQPQQALVPSVPAFVTETEISLRGKPPSDQVRLCASRS